jgi:RimJ/RimL family protein N-acetyltransferase
VGETPLPIPNRAVKPHSADGTWPARAWESRSPPVLSPQRHEPPPGGSVAFRVPPVAVRALSSARVEAVPIEPDPRDLRSPVATERLRLEPWRHDRHKGALAAVNRDPDVVRFLTGGVPIPPEETELLSLDIERHWATYGFGLWAVVERASTQALGFVGLSHPRWFPALAPAVEVGWRLRREAWGRGFASEGARAALEYGFGALALDEIIALIHPENARSAAVARRLGMAVVRTLPHPFRAHELEVHAVRRDAGRGATR